MAGSVSRAAGEMPSEEPPEDSAALWGPPGQEPVIITPANGDAERRRGEETPDWAWTPERAADAATQANGAGSANVAGAPEPVASGAVRTLGTPPTSSPILAAQKTATAGTEVEALDGQGQVWEYDFGDRGGEPSQPKDADDPSNWDVDLDQPDGWVDEGGKAAPADPRRRKLFLTVAAVLVAVIAGLSIPGLLSPNEEEPAGDTVVLGRRLTAPVALTLPEGAVATADESYVGVQFDTGGWVLVTVPEQVVTPGGTRAPMPADPAGWLRQHPDVFVSGVRSVEVDGHSATQIDYRRSSMAEPQSRYARLALFCGWRGEEPDSTGTYRSSTRPSTRECTQITNDARVRATFIQVEGRTLLVEAIWRPYGVWGWRMPTTLRDSYNELLAGLSPRAAEPGEKTSLTSSTPRS